MRHLKEYNKYLADQNTIYRVWDTEHNVLIEFEESGSVFLASTYSEEGKEILSSLGINPSQHEIENEKIHDILVQIREKYTHLTVEQW